MRIINNVVHVDQGVDRSLANRVSELEARVGDLEKRLDALKYAQVDLLQKIRDLEHALELRR